MRALMERGVLLSVLFENFNSPSIRFPSHTFEQVPHTSHPGQTEFGNAGQN